MLIVLRDPSGPHPIPQGAPQEGRAKEGNGKEAEWRRGATNRRKSQQYDPARSNHPPLTAYRMV